MRAFLTLMLALGLTMGPAACKKDKGDKGKKSAEKVAPAGEKKKPEVTKGVEKKPVEAKPTEAKKPEVAKGVEKKPVEAKPTEAKKPEVAKGVEKKPVEAKPTEAKKPEVAEGVEKKPVEAKSGAFLPELAGLEKILTDGMTAVIFKGAAPDKAFGDITAVSKGADRLAQARAEAKAAGGVKLALAAIELDVEFLKGDKVAAKLKTEIVLLGGNRSFMAFRARAAEGEETPRGIDPAKLAGSIAALAKASAAIATRAQTAGCTSFPIVPEAMIAKFAPPRERSRAAELITRTTADMKKACRLLAKLDSDGIRLKLDDVIFLALDKDGNALGIVRGELEKDGDKVVFEIGKFKPYQPPK